MNPEERDQLGRFLQLLESAHAGSKDPDAQAMISSACARQPDAAYLLVQRVMQLEIAQRESLAEIARLTRAANEAQTSGLPPSFFGGNAWGRQPAQAAATAPLAPVAAPAATPAARPQAQQTTWGSGLLGTVASTAMGVVAGSMIAQGIGSLFSNRDAGHAPQGADIPPGGGTLVETDYGAGRQAAGEDYIAEDFDSSGDTPDVG